MHTSRVTHPLSCTVFRPQITARHQRKQLSKCQLDKQVFAGLVVRLVSTGRPPTALQFSPHPVASSFLDGCAALGDASCWLHQDRRGPVRSALSLSLSLFTVSARPIDSSWRFVVGGLQPATVMPAGGVAENRAKPWQSALASIPVRDVTWREVPSKARCVTALAGRGHNNDRIAGSDGAVDDLQAPYGHRQTDQRCLVTHY